MYVEIRNVFLLLCRLNSRNRYTESIPFLDFSRIVIDVDVISFDQRLRFRLIMA